MGRQINYFALPEDMATIEAAIRDTADVTILSWRNPTSTPVQIPSIVVSLLEMGHVDLQAAVVRTIDLHRVRAHRVPQQGYWMLDGGYPVLEVSACYFDGSLLRRDRIYYYTGEGNPEDYQGWGSRVLRAVRKVLHKDESISPTAYIGDRALQWAREVGARDTGEELHAQAPPHVPKPMS